MYAIFFHTDGLAASCVTGYDTQEQAESLAHYWSGKAVRHESWTKIRVVEEDTLKEMAVITW